MHRIALNLNERSISLVTKLNGSVRQLMLYWVMVASFCCGIRLSIGTTPETLAAPASWLPYALVVAAPVASLMLALYWFRDGHRLPQPATRLARFGRWRAVPAHHARHMRLYGSTGIMASLLVGMLINIPVRTLEFLAAMPVLGVSPPAWFGSLFMLMLADVVLFSSLYAIAFVAALRHVPHFPRLLGAIWVADILMQIGIARIMAGVADVPPAVAGALHGLLEGNLKKVLISVAIWLPYILLSKRVNLTFRHRVPA